MNIDPATEAQHLAALVPMMKDEHPFTVKILVRDAWMLVAAIQLSTTAPNVGNSQRKWMTHVAKQFQGAIDAIYPEVGQILEMGWHREFDVERDE